MTQATKNGVEPPPDPAASSAKRVYTRPTITVERITSLVLGGGPSPPPEERPDTKRQP